MREQWNVVDFPDAANRYLFELNPNRSAIISKVGIYDGGHF